MWVSKCVVLVVRAGTGVAVRDSFNSGGDESGVPGRNIWDSVAPN